MALSDAESSEISGENAERIKRTYSTKKNNNQNDKLFKSLNEFKDDDNKEIKKYDRINEINLSDEEDAKNITIIYKYITRTLENFIEKNYSNFKFLKNSLKTIYSHIKAYIESLNQVRKENNKQNQKDDNNQNLLYEFKISYLNQQIKDLKYEIELLSSNEKYWLDDNSPKKYKIYNYLKKKNVKLQNKTKLDEFKYLLCIKEQQNKINDLENKLKLKILENSKEVKESKCFPNISQFDLKEHINAKSIPLTETILKNSKSSKKNLSKITEFKKDYFLTVTNSGSKTPFKMLTDKSNKIYDKKSKKKGLNQGLFKSININLNDEKTNEKKLNKRNEADDYFNILKLNSEIIPNKDKKFFISHPNLTIAGINQRLNKYNIGIPNKLFSFKFSKNINKNAFYKFPSTLNGIFVELEKLRINQNNTEI